MTSGAQLEIGDRVEIDAAEGSEGQYERVTTLLAWVLVFAGAVVTLVRLLYGADFIDEAFYAAQTYHFALGARPLIDQIDPHQTAAILMVPWVKLHLAIFGDTTGIMLSMRVCWAVLNGAASVLAYRLLRKFTDPRVAMLAAVSSFAMMPYMIPAPSFNTLGVIFESMAASLLGLALFERSGWPRYVAAGVALGLATVAYPTLGIAAVVAVVGVAWLARGWREPLFVTAGGLAVGLIGLGLLAPYASGIPAVLEYTRLNARLNNWGGARGGGLSSKFLGVLYIQSRWFLTQVTGILAVVVAFLQARKVRVPWWLSAAVLISLPFLPIGVRYPTDTRTLVYCSTIMLVALALILSLRRGEKRSRTDQTVVLRAVLLFGLVVGIIYAVTSSNSWIFIGIGAAAVLAPGIVVIVEGLRGSLVTTKVGDLLPLLQVLAAGFVLGTFAWFAMTGAYRDLPPLELHAQATEGPYAGLITTVANVEDSEKLWDEMKRVAGPNDRVLSYHGLPAGYLFSPAKSALPSIWISPDDAIGVPAITENYLRALADPAHKPTVVIRNLSWPSPGVYQSQNPSGYDPAADAVEKFVEWNYHVVASTPSWQLLLPNATK